MTQVSGRFEIERWEKPRLLIVKDYYNANPVSFNLALKSFEELPVAGRRIVVAGDMLELGPESANYHRSLGKDVARTSSQLLVAVGQFGKDVIRGAQEVKAGIAAVHLSSHQKVAEYLHGILKDGDGILLKASHGMKFEEIAEQLKKEYAAEFVGA